MVVLGGGGVAYERGTPVSNPRMKWSATVNMTCTGFPLKFDRRFLFPTFIWGRAPYKITIPTVVEYSRWCVQGYLAHQKPRPPEPL